MGKFSIRYFLRVVKPAAAGLVLLSSCASIQTPTGGPRDKIAPKVVSENPRNGSLNFNAKKIEIGFDEFIKLSNESKEISISPAFDKNPEFKVKKKVLVITFQDTLEKNTTYTINTGNAIVDYNEGNILKNYSYVFSTGNVIDSLSISGNLMSSITRKPVPEVTVILITARQDTLFTKKRASIFALTDSAGNFKIKNLKSGDYKVYGLKESGTGDRIYNSSNEEIAFLQDSIHLTTNTTGVQLRLFKEIPSLFRILDRKIQPDGRISLTFNRPVESPALKIIDPVALNTKKVTEFNTTGDSVSMWLPEMTFDSLNIEVSEKAIPLDTITLKRSKSTTYTSALTTVSNISNSRLREKKDLILSFSAPVVSIDPVKIAVLEDSIAVSGAQLLRDSLSARNIRIKYPWKNRKKYIVQVNDKAVTGINGGTNKAYNDGFIIDTDDNYAILELNVTVPEPTGTYIIQLLRNETDVVASRTVAGNAKITFLSLSPGTYTTRVIYDSNKNGKWDTGNLRIKTQPETIWNSDQKFSVRANFEGIEEFAIPPEK